MQVRVCCITNDVLLFWLTNSRWSKQVLWIRNVNVIVKQNLLTVGKQNCYSRLNQSTTQSINQYHCDNRTWLHLH